MAIRKISLRKRGSSFAAGDVLYPVTSWNYITDKPTSYNPASHNHDWDDITGEPSFSSLYLGKTEKAADSDKLDGLDSSSFASTKHKYHTFTNGDYYWDSYSQSNYFRMFSANAFSDTIRYGAVANVEYHNGTSWTPWSGGDTEIKKLLDGREDTASDFHVDRRRFRFEVTRNGTWPTTGIFILQETWTNLPHPDTDITIETWDGNQWNIKDTFTFDNTTTNDSLGWHVYVTSQVHDGKNPTRITVEMADWTANINGSYNHIPIKRIMFLSNYNGAKLHPWKWNYDKQVTFDWYVDAEAFFENGTRVYSPNNKPNHSAITDFDTAVLALSPAGSRPASDVSAWAKASSLAAASVPNLDAGKITTGVFNSSRIPSISTAKLPIDNTALATVIWTGAQISSELSGKLDNGDVSAWAKASVKPSYTFSEIGSKPTTLAGYGITDGKTATQITTEIQAAIDALIGGAPGALDTLNELAAALNDDADFHAAVTTALAGKMSTSHPANNITSTHLYMANGDGFVWDDTNNIMYVRSDGTDYKIYHEGHKVTLSEIGAAAENHIHDPGDITALDTAIQSVSPSGSRPASDVYAWAKASSLAAASVPALAISKITGLQTALDSKLAGSYMTSHESLHPAPTNRDTRNQVAGSYASSSHTHVHSNITDFDSAVLALSPAGSRPASDVSTWAKASTKPSYSFSEITGTIDPAGDFADFPAAVESVSPSGSRPASDVYAWAKASSLAAASVPALAISKITGLQTALDSKLAGSYMTSHESLHPAPTNRDTRNQVAGSYASSSHTHSSLVEQRVSDDIKIWVGTEASYNSLGTKDSDTLYFCT